MTLYLLKHLEAALLFFFHSASKMAQRCELFASPLPQNKYNSAST